MLGKMSGALDSKPDPLLEHIEELQRQQARDPTDDRAREIAELLKFKANDDLLRRFVEFYSPSENQKRPDVG